MSASAEPAPGVKSESLRLASIWSCTGKNMELAEIMQRGDEMARELRHQHAYIAEIEGQRNELVDIVCSLQAKLERIKKIEGENSTDSWLELSDDDKRTWFALAVQKGRERLKRVIELEDQLEAIGAGGVSALIPGRPADVLAERERCARLVESAKGGQSLAMHELAAAIRGA